MAAIAVAVIYAAAQFLVPQPEAMAGAITAMNIAVVVPHCAPTFNRSEAFFWKYAPLLVGYDSIIVPDTSLNNVTVLDTSMNTTLNDTLDIVEPTPQNSTRNMITVVTDWIPPTSSIFSASWMPLNVSASAWTSKFPTYSNPFKTTWFKDTNSTTHTQEPSREYPDGHGFTKSILWIAALTTVVSILVYCIHRRSLAGHPYYQLLFSAVLSTSIVCIVIHLLGLDAPLLATQNYLSGLYNAGADICPEVECLDTNGTIHNQGPSGAYFGLHVLTTSIAWFTAAISNLPTFVVSYLGDLDFLGFVRRMLSGLYDEVLRIGWGIGLFDDPLGEAPLKAVFKKYGGRLSRFILDIVRGISRQALDTVSNMSYIILDFVRGVSRQALDVVVNIWKQCALAYAHYYVIGIGLVILGIVLLYRPIQKLWRLGWPYVQEAGICFWWGLKSIWATFAGGEALQLFVEGLKHIGRDTLNRIRPVFTWIVDGIAHIFRLILDSLRTGLAWIVAGCHAVRNIAANLNILHGLRLVFARITAGWHAVRGFAANLNFDFGLEREVLYDWAKVVFAMAIKALFLILLNDWVKPSTNQALPHDPPASQTALNETEPGPIAAIWSGMVADWNDFMALLGRVGHALNVFSFFTVCPLSAWRWLWRTPTIALLAACSTIPCLTMLRAWPQHETRSTVTVFSLAVLSALIFVAPVGGLECIQDYLIVVVTVIIILLFFWLWDNVPVEVQASVKDGVDDAMDGLRQLVVGAHVNARNEVAANFPSPVLAFQEDFTVPAEAEPADQGAEDLAGIPTLPSPTTKQSSAEWSPFSEGLQAEAEQARAGAEQVQNWPDTESESVLVASESSDKSSSERPDETEQEGTTAQAPKPHQACVEDSQEEPTTEDVVSGNGVEAIQDASTSPLAPSSSKQSSPTQVFVPEFEEAVPQLEEPHGTEAVEKSEAGAGEVLQATPAQVALPEAEEPRDTEAVEEIESEWREVLHATASTSAPMPEESAQPAPAQVDVPEAEEPRDIEPVETIESDCRDGLQATSTSAPVTNDAPATTSTPPHSPPTKGDVAMREALYAIIDDMKGHASSNHEETSTNEDPAPADVMDVCGSTPPQGPPPDAASATETPDTMDDEMPDAPDHQENFTVSDIGQQQPQQSSLSSFQFSNFPPVQPPAIHPVTQDNIAPPAAPGSMLTTPYILPSFPISQQAITAQPSLPLFDLATLQLPVLPPQATETQPPGDPVDLGFRFGRDEKHEAQQSNHAPEVAQPQPSDSEPRDYATSGAAEQSQSLSRSRISSQDPPTHTGNEGVRGANVDEGNSDVQANLRKTAPQGPQGVNNAGGSYTAPANQYHVTRIDENYEEEESEEKNVSNTIDDDDVNSTGLDTPSNSEKADSDGLLEAVDDVLNAIKVEDNIARQNEDIIRQRAAENEKNKTEQNGRENTFKSAKFVGPADDKSTQEWEDVTKPTANQESQSSIAPQGAGDPAGKEQKSEVDMTEPIDTTEQGTAEEISRLKAREILTPKTRRGQTGLHILPPMHAPPSTSPNGTIPTSSPYSAPTTALPPTPPNAPFPLHSPSQPPSSAQAAPLTQSTLPRAPVASDRRASQGPTKLPGGGRKASNASPVQPRSGRKSAPATTSIFGQLLQEAKSPVVPEQWKPRAPRPPPVNGMRSSGASPVQPRSGATPGTPTTPVTATRSSFSQILNQARNPIVQDQRKHHAAQQVPVHGKQSSDALRVQQTSPAPAPKEAESKETKTKTEKEEDTPLPYDGSGIYKARSGKEYDVFFDNETIGDAFHTDEGQKILIGDDGTLMDASTDRIILDERVLGI